MASLVEFQDIHLNSHHCDILQAIPESCDMSTLEDFMSQNAEPLPTPPLSPDNTEGSSRCSSPTSEESYDMEIMEIGERLLADIMKTDYDFDQDYLSGDSQGSSSYGGLLEANFLIQDCMWNSGALNPVSNSSAGVYTPAPSPPPPAAPTKEKNEKPDKDITPTPSGSKDQTECISPCDVFPLFMPQEELSQDVKSRKTKAEKHGQKKLNSHHSSKTSIMTRRSVSVSGNNPRIQPQATTTSESDEEIDVVTVSERPATRMKSRKRLFSVSAPCSRHTSPTPSSPVKKRRYMAKRHQRLSSAGSNMDFTESDDEQRRASHNILERKRRNDLKYSFQVLRGQIPELEDNQRAPKVTILRKATDYIRQIQEQEEKMQLEFEREKKREAKLRQRLAHLKATPSIC